MITVVMTTYSPGSIRANYSLKVLESLAQNLVCSLPLRLHIADDGSEYTKHFDSLLDVSRKAWRTQGTISNSRRAGVGASLNRALEILPKGSLWMYITDDWMLVERLDVTQAVDLILNEGYKYVRLGPIHPNLACRTKFNQRCGWWLELDPSKGGFVFATRPFVASKDFTDHYGPFAEKTNAYVAESNYSGRVFDDPTIGMAQIGTINLSGPWEHIGEYEVGTIEP